MTPTDDQIADVAGRLTKAQRDIAVALCGNAWTGEEVTPGIRVMNSLEMMHIAVLKDGAGRVKRFKAKPTPLGLAVRAHLIAQGEGK
jgi:hypothetical protein